MRRIPPDCCALTLSGQAAAPPSSERNSRRLKTNFARFGMVSYAAGRQLRWEAIKKMTGHHGASRAPTCCHFHPRESARSGGV
jgi:hypothetical protein